MGDDEARREMAEELFRRLGGDPEPDGSDGFDGQAARVSGEWWDGMVRVLELQGAVIGSRALLLRTRDHLATRVMDSGLSGLEVDAGLAAGVDDLIGRLLAVADWGGPEG